MEGATQGKSEGLKPRRDVGVGSELERASLSRDDAASPKMSRRPAWGPFPSSLEGWPRAMTAKMGTWSQVVPAAEAGRSETAEEVRSDLEQKPKRRLMQEPSAISHKGRNEVEAGTGTGRNRGPEQHRSRELKPHRGKQGPKPLAEAEPKLEQRSTRGESGARTGAGISFREPPRSREADTEAEEGEKEADAESEDGIEMRGPAQELAFCKPLRSREADAKAEGRKEGADAEAEVGA